MSSSLPRELGRLPRFAYAATLILVVVVLLLTVRGGASALDPAEQVIDFNHGKHIAAGVQCLYCHPGGLHGRVSSIPSLEKCMGCHHNVEVSGEGAIDVEVLLSHWEQGKSLQWEKTTDQPDFVFFNHRPHIAAGVSCESCHGDVASMAKIKQAYRVNMGFCLHCHKKQDKEIVPELIACATCHN
jgi:hypothetical protein